MAERSSTRRQAGVVVHAEHGLGVLELSKGNYRAALEHAGRVDAEDSYSSPRLGPAALRPRTGGDWRPAAGGLRSGEDQIGLLG